MLRHLISKGLTQQQIEIKQQIAMLLDDFKPKELTLPSLTATSCAGDRKAASSPRTVSGASIRGIACPLPAIFWSRIQATLVPYQLKGLTLKKRSC